MLHSFFYVMWYDIRSYITNLSTLATVCLFYLSIIIVIPFGLDGNSTVISQSSTGFIWIAFVLCALLCIEKQFSQDIHTDILDILSLRYSLALICFSKAIAVWVAILLPLILFTPLSAILLHLPFSQLYPLLISLLVGSPAIAFIITLGGALSLTHNRGSLLVAILCLPLCIPVLIFGVTAASVSIYGYDNNTSGLKLLFALDLLAVALLPWASGEILRIELENK